MLKGTGKSGEGEVEDWKEELDGQGRKKGKRGVRGARNELIEKGK